MAALSLGRRRAFVQRHTRLAPVPGLEGIRLHLGDDAMALMHATGDALGIADPPLPFWAFAWPGGLAIARYLVDHPEEVARRRVLDLASGSGICAIVAARAGAATTDASDVDPFADAAIRMNARANDVRVGAIARDLVRGPSEGYDIILAGDVCYEETMATRILAWLADAASKGTRVLIGDPGRSYLPEGLDPLAAYQIEASREIEGAERRVARVYTLDTAGVIDMSRERSPG